MPTLRIPDDWMDLLESADCYADGNSVMHCGIWCHFASQANSVNVPGVDSGKACQYCVVHQPILGSASCRFRVCPVYEPRGKHCGAGGMAHSMGMLFFAGSRGCESVT